jgi:hypothetical protein
MKRAAILLLLTLSTLAFVAQAQSTAMPPGHQMLASPEAACAAKFFATYVLSQHLL